MQNGQTAGIVSAGLRNDPSLAILGAVGDREINGRELQARGTPGRRSGTMALTNRDFLEGGCLCGRVRFTVDPGGVFDAGWCHCSICRKSSGSAASAWVNVAPAAFRLAAHRPVFYRSSGIGRRAFCPDCGSQLYFELDDAAAYVSIGLGCFDLPEELSIQPRVHMFAGQRLDCFDAGRGLPDFADNTLSHPDKR